jgi:hypothetical protein
MKTAVEWLEEFLNSHCNPSVCNVEYSDFKLAIQQAKEMEKAEKIKAQIDVLNLLNDTHPLRINIMIRKLKEQLKLLTFKSE